MYSLRAARAKRVLALFTEEQKSVEQIAALTECSTLEVCELLMEGRAEALWELSRRQLSHISIKRCGRVARLAWPLKDAQHDLYPDSLSCRSPAAS